MKLFSPLWYKYHDWGAIGYLTTKLGGGGGYNGKDPDFSEKIYQVTKNEIELLINSFSLKNRKK